MKGNSSFFVHKVLLDRCHTHFLMYYQWLLLSPKDRIRSLQQRPSGTQNWMYLLSDSLRKSLPTPGLDGLNKKKDILQWILLLCVEFTWLSWPLLANVGHVSIDHAGVFVEVIFRENEAFVHLIRVYCVNWEKVGKDRSGRKQSRRLAQIQVLSLRVWHGAALWPLCASTSSSVTWGQWGREPRHVDSLYRERASL